MFELSMEVRNAMELEQLTRKSEIEWWIEPKNGMRVPGIIYGTEALVRAMDQKVYEQVANVATLPGIETDSYAMPDAHWGYGFPIGGVAAFDADRGDRRAGKPRGDCSQPFVETRCRGSSRGLQGRHRSGGCRGSGGPVEEGRAAGADHLHQGLKG